MNVRGVRVHPPSAKSITVMENLAATAGLIALYGITGSFPLVLIVALLYLAWYVTIPVHRL